MSLCLVGLLGFMLGSGTGFAQSNSDTILQKQQEVDQYLFEEHSQEIKEKGITVTNTGPQDGYVEIGITPFNEENANYLYGIFGKDKIKIVEGIQANTMSTNDSSDNKDVISTTKVNKEETKHENPFFIPLGLSLIIGLLLIIFLKRKGRESRS